MSDKIFEYSLTSLTAVVVVGIILGIVLAAVGLPWINADLPGLIFFTILIGLLVLIIGGGALLYFWGKNYMARG